MSHAGDRPGPAPGSGTGPLAPPAAGDGGQARALLEAVFDTTAAGLAILSGPELRYAKVSPAHRALVPDPAADPLGRTFEEVWAPGGEAMAGELREALERGEARREDELVVTGGLRRHFSFQATRVGWGDRPALLLELRETTAFAHARASAEAAVEHALRRAGELDAVIDAIADGFILFGPRGEVRRVNATAARLVEGAGPDARAALTELFSGLEITTPEGRPVSRARAPVARALAGQTVLGAHLHVTLPGGRSGWILASAAPIIGPDGKIAGAVLTFSDETAVHELQEARDDLVRMISHDLRTPLSAVYTQSHLLQRAPADPVKVAERGRAIARSCQRMSAMIGDLVEATLVEAGQLRLERTAVNLEAALAELLERLRGGLDVDRVRLTVQPGLPLADADPARLERVLVNLLSNALKYSPPESAVEVVLGPVSEGVQIAVADRGVGISPEDVPLLFQRFFRARGNRQPEGLGLGLYITRRLVEAHGGRVEVESLLGQGTTFRVLLPASR